MGLFLYLLGAVVALMLLAWIKDVVTRPADLPPVYREFP
jgi:hypothetical protein